MEKRFRLSFPEKARYQILGISLGSTASFSPPKNIHQFCFASNLFVHLLHPRLTFLLIKDLAIEC